MQELAPHTSPIFVSAFRLLPAGLALVAWAAATGRQQPRGLQAWLACTLFGLVDGTAFQVCRPLLGCFCGKPGFTAPCLGLLMAMLPRCATLSWAAFLLGAPIRLPDGATLALARCRALQQRQALQRSQRKTVFACYERSQENNSNFGSNITFNTSYHQFILENTAA